MMDSCRLTSDLRLHIPDNVGSLPDFLISKMRVYTNRKALIDSISGRSMTFQELCENIPRLGASLWHKCGVRAGTRVGLVAPNCIEYPLSYLAIMHVGAVCVPINYLSTKYELKTLLEDSECSVVLTTPELQEKFRYVQRNLPSEIRQIVLIGDEPGFTSVNQLIRDAPDYIRHSPQVSTNAKECLASISYSSGTTGFPKGCMHSHLDYITNICQQSHPDIQAFQNGQDVTIAALQMSHMYGQSVYLTHCLSVGCTMIVMERFRLQTYLNFVQTYRATILHVVPPILIELIKSSVTDQFDFSSVRNIETSAASLHQETAKQFIGKFPNCSLRQGYGMTEALFFIMERRGTKISSSTGKLLPGISIKIVHPASGELVRVGEDGELCFLTPMATSGFWRNPSENKKLFDAEGYIKTGDIGHCDASGNFRIVDRIKDLIKYKGNQVSPAELESVILRHPKVADVAVVGIPDADAGELPKAFVVKKDNEALDEMEIIEFVKKYVSPFKRLHGGVEFTREIPKSPSGKILRRLLRESPTQLSKL